MGDDLRSKLLALAEELGKEADELRSRAVEIDPDGGFPSYVPMRASKADGIKRAESRLRAILDESAAPGSPSSSLADHVAETGAPQEVVAKLCACRSAGEALRVLQRLGINDDRILYLLRVHGLDTWPLAPEQKAAALPKPERVEFGQRWRLPADCVLHVVEIGGHHTGAPWAEFDACDCEEMLSSPDWIYLGAFTGHAAGQQ